MAALPPPSSRLQSMLQAAVQSVHWTYSLFWQLCPQQRILVWGGGYYNGAIKTRKTVQPMEVAAEEASLERSQQLRELYESLMAGETNQPPAKRPCAALLPEDLTESEWFYLMCVSFSFPPGSGLPGKAYARRQHVWLIGANEVDSKTFSRAILAKSAKIQTVVCIPMLDGVVELGKTETVQEDLGFMEHIKSFFLEHGHHPQPPKPALSEHSTSNPSSSDSPTLPSLPQPINSTDPPPIVDQEDDVEDDMEADAIEEGGLNTVGICGHGGGAAVTAEMIQLDMSEDIQLGSPDDVSNNLETDFHLLAVGQRRGDSSFGAESGRRWLALEDQLISATLQPPYSETLEEGDTHYSQTVSTILQSRRSIRCADTSSTTFHVSRPSNQSAFSRWTKHSESRAHVVDGGSQRLLKCSLFTVPLLHGEYRDGVSSSPKLQAFDGSRRTPKAAQDELSVNHVMAERRRREKLNERFVVLRSLVPFVTKMDKASILGDTIEYVKHLRNKIQDLKAHNSLTETERQQKRKTRTSEAASGGWAKTAATVETAVEVSIIESDALLEIKCGYREGMLLGVLQLLRELRIETTAVQTAVNGGVFQAEIRAKVKENRNGKKASITEVKRAINQIIQL